MISIGSYAQSIDLTAGSPMLRVGDRLSIKYVVNSEKSGIASALVNSISESTVHSEGTKTKPSLPSCKVPDYQVANGFLTLSKNIDTIGSYTVGPFSFNLDGVLYKSDTLTFTVYPELPKVKNGLWINFIKSNDEYYLAIEQRIEGKENNPQPPSLTKEDDGYVSLNDAMLKDNDNVAITGIQYSRGNYSLEGEMGQADYMGTQKKTFYKIWMSDDYDNSLTLTKKYFTNLPKKMDFKPVMIER